MIKEIKLSKFNGMPCENLFSNLCYITEDKINDVIDLYYRVNKTMENSNWLKFRDFDYLKNVLDNGGFIIGCYMESTLIASALCESPQGDYLDILHEIGMSWDSINSTYISGYVMVDPIYRGNSLHRTLLESRIECSLLRDKKHIVTVVASDNIISLKTVLGLGFNVKSQIENQHGMIRNILIKDLIPHSVENEIFSASCI